MQESYFVNLHIKTYLKLYKINKIKEIYGVPLTFSPAAYDSLYKYFTDTKTSPDDYDLIITGDLGSVGKKILIDLFRMENNIDISKNYIDCGEEIYSAKAQDVNSGGSGAGCSASVLSGYILPEMKKGKWQRVLFGGTGALLSPLSSQQGESIPGICHVVCISK